TPGGVLLSAPSTSLNFLLLGIALALQMSCPQRRWARGFLLALGGVATLASLHVFIVGLRGETVSWEALFGPVDRVVGGIRIGHMSVYAAGLFLLTIFGFAGLFVENANASRFTKVGLIATAAGNMVTVVLTLIYAGGNPLFAATGSSTVAPSTALAFIVLN